MKGPLPKHPSRRARQNRATTSARLTADHEVVAPELPEREWHRLTMSWWADVWASPMAAEFDDSDKHGLFTLARLVDAFWTCDAPTTAVKIAAEIRQQGQRFGLSPIDRRRLQWEIEKAEAAEARKPKARPTGTTDPRAHLQALEGGADDQGRAGGRANNSRGA